MQCPNGAGVNDLAISQVSERPPASLGKIINQRSLPFAGFGLRFSCLVRPNNYGRTGEKRRLIQRIGQDCWCDEQLPQRAGQLPMVEINCYTLRGENSDGAKCKCVSTPHTPQNKKSPNGRFSKRNERKRNMYPHSHFAVCDNSARSVSGKTVKPTVVWQPVSCGSRYDAVELPDRLKKEPPSSKGDVPRCIAGALCPSYVLKEQ